jgi:hypothetical protein
MGKPFPGPWNFEHHPWAREMHDCTADLIVGQKCAQMGYTEVALNRAFFAIDVLGESVLYVLPAESPDAKDFSTSRFDAALELSTHLQSLFSDVKNIGHKRAGSASLFIRGSRSRSQLKSIPVGNIILDEMDEMYQENIPLAKERASGQQHKSIYEISTPTLENYGINADYKISDQRHYFFPCPACQKHIEFKFPDSLIVTADNWSDPKVNDSYLICYECKARLDHKLKSQYFKRANWVKTKQNTSVAGFHVNQLYSATVSPAEFAVGYLKSLTNPTEEQEFFNSKLGITHAVEGAKVTDQQVEEAKHNHRNGHTNRAPASILTIGIDVGKWIHCQVTEYINIQQATDINLSTKARVLKQTKLLTFDEVALLIQEYRPNQVVVDANPERRKAEELAAQFPGRVRLCFYTDTTHGRVLVKSVDDPSVTPTVTVNRTNFLDVSLGRFRTQRILLPFDTDIEYATHIKALTRVYKKDKSGEPIGVYLCGNEEDHYAHANNYCEIALSLCGMSGQSQIITKNVL